MRWVDSSSLFLIGRSEGGVVAAGYAGNEFKGRVISSDGCGKEKLKFGSTAIVILGESDFREVRHVHSRCEGAKEIFILKGVGHQVWSYGKTREIVTDFLGLMLQQ